MKKMRNTKNRVGRPAGAKTQYHGIKAFARKHAISHQFVRMVLNGEATSGPVLRNWARFQAERGD